MINLVGWLSTACLVLCGVPDTIRAFRTKVCGVPGDFLVIWTVGEVAGLLYCVVESGDIILISNYGWNTAICLVLCYYKFRKKDKI